MPDKIALSIVSGNSSQDWTYQALEDAVLATAGGFLAMGLLPGDRILMRLDNTVDFPICFLAAIAAGLVPVPTAAMLTAPEISKLSAELSPAIIVASPGVPLPEQTNCPVLSLAQFQALRTAPPATYVMGDPQRLAYIIYTSGTSGVPRAVCHAHRSIWARRMMWQGWYDLRPEDRLLHAGAFNWTYTLGAGLMDPWSMGATALIPGDGIKATNLPELLKTYDATIFAAAPGVYRQMLRSNFDGALSHLRHGLSAGEKLPDTIRANWLAATGTPLYEAYGMSECSTFISGSPKQPAPDGALGYPQPGRRIAVVDAQGTPVEYDQAGILAVSDRDPGLMLGYLGAEQETADRFQGEWFLTGDTVKMARDGAITYLGRADDMMNAGGFRVSPQEVERVLNSHPQISESAAAAVTVKADTTVIAAFYVAEAEIQSAELSAFVAGHLARYKTPRIFCHLTALPKSANGKILRRKLRETYEARHGQT